MTPTPLAESTARTAPTVVPGWAVWSLRSLTLLVVLQLLAQATLAGLFVTGDVGMLELHSINATFITAAIFFQLVAAILVWKPGGGVSWPIWASLTLFLLVQMQAGFGYARLVMPHIPGGVLMFGLAVAILVLTWSPRLRTRRNELTKGPTAP